jgi:hypothetical protein
VIRFTSSQGLAGKTPSSTSPGRRSAIKQRAKGYLRSAGRLSPVVLTSFSVVTVVVPPGVETFDSVLVVAVSEHPTHMSENMLRTSSDAKMRFMENLFLWKKLWYSTLLSPQGLRRGLTYYGLEFVGG